MASLYRPIVIDYRMPDGKTRDPDGKRVGKHTPNAVRIERRSKIWWGRWTDAQGKPHKQALSEKHGVARRMLAKLAGDAQLSSVGIEDKYAEHRVRPLMEHLDDFTAELRSKPITTKQVEQKSARCRRVLEGCKFVFTDDIEASALSQWLAERRQQDKVMPLIPAKQTEFTVAEVAAILGVKRYSVNPLVRRHRLEATGNGKARRFPPATVEALIAVTNRGIGTQTRNHYLSEFKSFCNWLVKRKRMPDNPLADLETSNAEADQRRLRRSLTQDELIRLLDAARNSTRVFRGMSGTDRTMIYRVACSTGFREGETASLLPEQFDLDSTPPIIRLAARVGKNRRFVEQPIPPDLVSVLREYLTGRDPRQPIWPGKWCQRGADMIKIDLAAAGIPYAIDGPDGPEYADFHALRHSFVSLLEHAGVTLKQAMALARHSDPKLTMKRYGKASKTELGGAIGKLPSLVSNKNAAQQPHDNPTITST